MADPEEAPDKRDRERRQQDQALDSLTDVVEDKQVDTVKVQNAMAALLASQKAHIEEQRQRERELASIKINNEDALLIATEFELDHKAAERRLRECKGDVLAALKSFL